CWAAAVSFFFFSSRRRHTRFSRDWSSDVCSSDLPADDGPAHPDTHAAPARRAYLDVLARHQRVPAHAWEGILDRACDETMRVLRSEERRVGEERRSRGAAYDERRQVESRACRLEV